MSVRARVIATEGNILTLRTIQESGCDGCKQCAKGQEEMELQAVSDVSYPVGSWVEVDIGAAELNAISLLVYGVPLLIMLLGIFIGNVILKRELLGFLIGFLGVVLYFLWLKARQKDINKNNRFSARVLGSVDPEAIQIQCKKPKEVR
ncbi:SoxR reducing system RseC family protein [Guggenheimella bovis]